MKAQKRHLIRPNCCVKTEAFSEIQSLALVFQLLVLCHGALIQFIL